jgi:hypothetical protein
MKYKEIITELLDQGISVKDFAFNNFINPLPNVGEWTEIKQEGGEGEGDHWHSIKYFKDHDVYIMTIGHYSSYYGIDFSDGYGAQVTPVKVETIDYQPIQTMSYKEIIIELKQQNVSVEEFALEYVDDIPEIGPWEKIHKYGGEGKGETWFVVYYFERHDVYIRIDGYYSSYDGVSFNNSWEDDAKEVKPQEKTITVYE